MPLSWADRDCVQIATRHLTADGKWHAFEGFLYEDDPTKTRAWEDFPARLLSQARADDWLTVIDCHC